MRFSGVKQFSTASITELLNSPKRYGPEITSSGGYHYKCQTNTKHSTQQNIIVHIGLTKLSVFVLIKELSK
jgi:uncharacterized membrane protein